MPSESVSGGRGNVTHSSARLVDRQSPVAYSESRSIPLHNSLAEGNGLIAHRKTVTDGGLRILTSRMPHTQSASIVLYVGAGSRYESPEEAGISHFVEHMCFKGTPRYPTAKHISEAIEGVGGVMNASTDRELTSYWCKVPLTHFQEALDVLADMVREPLYEPDEIEKERQVILEELAMTYDVPSYRAELLIDEVMWPDQPLGRDVGGTRDSVAGISRDMMLDYMHRQYTLSNLVVSIAGNIHHDEAIEAVQSRFRDWAGHTPGSWIPADDGQAAPWFGMERRKTEQAHVCIAVKGLSSTHPDRYALDLLSAVLGEGMSSRLFLELRERRGLVYDVHTTVSHLKDCGTFIAYAGDGPQECPHRRAEHPGGAGPHQRRAAGGGASQGQGAPQGATGAQDGGQPERGGLAGGTGAAHQQGSDREAGAVNG